MKFLRLGCLKKNANHLHKQSRWPCGLSHGIGRKGIAKIPWPYWRKVNCPCKKYWILERICSLWCCSLWSNPSTQSSIACTFPWLNATPKTCLSVGQSHLVGENGALTQMIQSGNLPSLLFWGPPGTGKTTLATLIAKAHERPFYNLSAIHSGVKEVREVIEKAKLSGGLFTNKGPLLFIDEIHRFSKSQQDSLLGAVDKGYVTLIGATTENLMEVINGSVAPPNLCLTTLAINDLRTLLKRASWRHWIKKYAITLEDDEALLSLSGGDAKTVIAFRIGGAIFSWKRSAYHQRTGTRASPNQYRFIR